MSVPEHLVVEKYLTHNVSETVCLSGSAIQILSLFVTRAITPNYLPDPAGMSVLMWQEAVCEKNLGIGSLISDGILKYEPISAEEAKLIIYKKRLIPYQFPNDFHSSNCQWCGTNTTAIERHHFPLTKREGGKKTVRLCPTCHREFHKLSEKNRIVIGQAGMEFINRIVGEIVELDYIEQTVREFEEEFAKENERARQS